LPNRAAFFIDGRRGASAALQQRIGVGNPSRWGASPGSYDCSVVATVARPWTDGMASFLRSLASFPGLRRAPPALWRAWLQGLPTATGWSVPRLFRQLSLGNFLFPFIHQGPIDGAGSEVGHRQITAQAIDGGLQQAVVLPKNGAVTGQ